MPMTLDEFRELDPEKQQEVLADLRTQREARIEAAVDAAFDRFQLESNLVPRIVFRPAPRTQTVNLDPPRMSDEQVREKFRQDPNLRELVVSGVKYERL